MNVLQPAAPSQIPPSSAVATACLLFLPVPCPVPCTPRVTNRSIWMHGRGAVRSDSQRRVGGCAHRIMGIRQTITDHNGQNARPWAGAWPTRGTGNPTPCVPPKYQSRHAGVGRTGDQVAGS